MGKLFGKKKIDEKNLINWVSKTLKEGSDMEQIKAVLNKEYNKKDVKAFLKKNFGVETKEEGTLDEGIEEEKKKKGDMDELDEEIKNLKKEAAEEEPTEEETPDEKPKEQKETQKEVPIQKMSTYDVELLNQVASINQGIMKLIQILSKK